MERFPENNLAPVIPSEAKNPLGSATPSRGCEYPAGFFASFRMTVSKIYFFHMNPPLLSGQMHEIDYKIHGDDMQFVEVELDPQEAVVAEAGGMMFMDDNIAMETVFGDGAQRSGDFLGSLLGAGKRLLTGESLFMTVFQNQGAGKRRVAFGAPYPGKIIPVHLRDLGGELIAQKDSFLCAAKGVSIGIRSNVAKVSSPC